MPIHPNLTPIGCQSDGNPVPIHANPMSIKCPSDVNQEPIQRQSVANPTSIQHQSDDNQVPIRQANLPIHDQSTIPMSILYKYVNSSPIRQFNTNLPIRYQSDNPMSILDQSIDPSLSQINKYDTGQSSISCLDHRKIDRHRFDTGLAQIAPILHQSEATTVSNLGTSALQGSLPKCLDGGRFGRPPTRSDQPIDAIR